MMSAVNVDDCRGGVTNRTRQGWQLAAICVALALGGCHEASGSSPPPTQAVTVAVAGRTDTARDLRLSGTIEPERSITLSFLAAGTIAEVWAHEGEVVRRGQKLARLAPQSFEDALGIAKAKAQQAEDAYRRLEPMYRNHTLPEVKWVEVETGLRQAQLAVAMAQRSVADTVLRAPEDGVVSRRSAEPGMTAIPGSPVITLVRMGTVLATAPVPETHISRVRVGAPAQVAVAALGRTFEGVIREVGVTADPLTRTYPVKVAVANPNGELRLGMVIVVRLHQEGGPPAVVVPSQAVRVDESGAPCVYVVEQDGRVRRKAVEVAGFIGEGTTLSRGIAEGERVVTSGTPMLADGVAVTVAERSVEER
jgi:RND family efflux transporter MFP subunit